MSKSFLTLGARLPFAEPCFRKDNVQVQRHVVRHQPPASRNIGGQRIERGLQQRRFERSRDGYQPTDLTLALLEHAERSVGLHMQIKPALCDTRSVQCSCSAAQHRDGISLNIAPDDRAFQPTLRDGRATPIIICNCNFYLNLRYSCLCTSSPSKHCASSGHITPDPPMRWPIGIPH